MSYHKPFHRNFRELIERTNSGYSSWAFIVDKDYAQSPHHYTRAFLLLQEDIKNLFEYIEPADINLNTFSYRIHELFMRTCIEIEANFKAILRENTYTPLFENGPKKGQLKTEDNWNIFDYIKINTTHHLDDYHVEFPFWRWNKNIYKPFLKWKTKESLAWYRAYNECKHNRNEKFELANLENLLNAFTWLFILLSAQFNCESFTPWGKSLWINVDNYFEWNFGIGNYLKIQFPKNWEDNEKYDFDWSILKKETIKFEKINYNYI